MPTVLDGLNGNHLIECHHIVSGCRVIDCVHVPEVRNSNKAEGRISSIIVMVDGAWGMGKEAGKRQELAMRQGGKYLQGKNLG